MRFLKNVQKVHKALKNKEKMDTPKNVHLVRVFITDLILRHSAGLVETYSQSAENACAYKEFCNTKGI